VAGLKTPIQHANPDAAPPRRTGPVAQYVQRIALNPRCGRLLFPPNPNHFNIFLSSASLADKLQFVLCLLEARLGCPLNPSSAYTVGMPVADSKKKNSLLPLLIVIFIVSYGLMTMLIVEQGSTIQSQSNLIKVLLPDSRDLWAQRAKAINNNSIAAAQIPDKSQDKGQDKVQAPSAQAPASPAPSRQAPSAQAPAVPAPSTPSKSVPQHGSENRAGKTLKPQVEAPPTPTSDLLDQRRSLNSI
jgi:hypothetical protein